MSRLVYRHSSIETVLAIFAAHDAPIAIGFAADHHDMNIFGAEDGNQLMVGGFEFGGMGFYAIEGQRMNVVLDQLIVPQTPAGMVALS
ncbi:MAG: hypothetical protein R2911_23025 [Caldilineaceae bacterium]